MQASIILGQSETMLRAEFRRHTNQQNVLRPKGESPMSSTAKRIRAIAITIIAITATNIAMTYAMGSGAPFGQKPPEPAPSAIVE